MCLFWAALGLGCCARAFSSNGEWGLPSRRGAQASYCSGFSHCRAQAPELMGFSTCGSRALERGLSSCGERAELWHAGSS